MNGTHISTWQGAPRHSGDRASSWVGGRVCFPGFCPSLLRGQLLLWYLQGSAGRKNSPEKASMPAAQQRREFPLLSNLALNEYEAVVTKPCFYIIALRICRKEIVQILHIIRQSGQQGRNHEQFTYFHWHIVRKGKSPWKCYESWFSFVGTWMYVLHVF